MDASLHPKTEALTAVLIFTNTIWANVAIAYSALFAIMSFLAVLCSCVLGIHAVYKLIRTGRNHFYWEEGSKKNE